jgi:hypothetical protein
VGSHLSCSGNPTPATNLNGPESSFRPVFIG